MRTLRIVMIVLATMMVAFLLWNLTLTGTYEAVAEADIPADSPTIRSYTEDLQRWEEWSTYLRRDTSLELTFSTPSSGERAWVSWKSVSGPGGRMEIMKVGDDKIEYLLTFQGFQGAKSLMKFTPGEENTHIRWSITGELPFYARFMKSGFENIVKTDLDRSLSQLNSIITSGSLPDTSEENPMQAGDDSMNEASESETPEGEVAVISEGQWEAHHFYYIAIESSIVELPWSKLTAAYDEVQEFLGEPAANAPLFIMYDVYDDKHDYTRIHAGIIADIDLPQSSVRVKSDLIRQGIYIESEVSGDLRNMNYGSEKLDEHMQLHGYRMQGQICERIILNPDMTPARRFVRYPVIPATESISMN